MESRFFLKQAVEHKKREVEDIFKEPFPVGLYAKKDPDSTFNFLTNERRRRGFFIIAEIKRASPSKGILDESIVAGARAKLYEQMGASAISVLTDGRWFKGSLDDLNEVASSVRVPVMMKDFVVDRRQLLLAAHHGASMVLLIVKVLGSSLAAFVEEARRLGLEPLVEASCEEEIDLACDSGARLVGVNSRNLETLEVDRNIFKKVSSKVRKKACEGIVFVAESGISKREEVVDALRNGFCGVLVGSRLSAPDGPEFLASLQTVRIEEVL